MMSMNSGIRVVQERPVKQQQLTSPIIRSFFSPSTASPSASVFDKSKICESLNTLNSNDDELEFICSLSLPREKFSRPSNPVVKKYLPN